MELDFFLKNHIEYIRLKGIKKKTMKKAIVIFCLFILCGNGASAKIPLFLKKILPTGTVIFTDIAYAGDTLTRHTLDLYLPPRTGNTLPLLIWIHGGGWRAGNKYNDMDYMTNTLKAILENGYALASIEYRYRTTAIFPAQIQDCNRAADYLYENSGKYTLDKDKMALIGFSAGGYLASLLATSNNDTIEAFYYNKIKPRFKIRAAIDFFGPTDFIARIGSMKLDEGNQKSTSTELLGAQPVNRPDLAKVASATTYIDQADPPFLIFHGDKDTTVPITLSKLLDSYLQLAKVHSEFVIVNGAPHGGKLFGSEVIKNKILVFLNTYLK